jgi:hypothetical protein
MYSPGSEPATSVTFWDECWFITIVYLLKIKQSLTDNLFGQPEVWCICSYVSCHLSFHIHLSLLLLLIYFNRFFNPFGLSDYIASKCIMLANNDLYGRQKGSWFNWDYPDISSYPFMWDVPVCMSDHKSTCVECPSHTTNANVILRAIIFGSGFKVSSDLI